jgi:acyl-CoA thioester hydrolase
MNPAHQAEVEITIPFHDVDMVHFAWHGHYAKYFEIARSALLDHIDYNYDAMHASGYLWPIIDMRVRFIKPARLGQRILVKATLREWEHRLLIEYLVRDAVSGQRLTKGSTAQVAVSLATGEMCFESPAILFERLGFA